jgi:hypothetical protein
VLTGWNCLVAAVVVRSVWRAARPTRINVSHSVALPIRLRMPEGVRMVISRAISVDEIELADDTGTFDVPGTPIDAEIFLPSGSVRVLARIERPSGRSAVRLSLHWPHVTERDRLDHALHAGRWHRVVGGRFEMVRTPFEWLGLLEAPPGRMPDSHPQWRPVLVQPVDGAKDSAQLGYMLPAPQGSAVGEIILFSPPMQPFAIHAANEPEAGPYETAGPAVRPQLDENALRSAGGVRHAFRPASAPAQPPHLKTAALAD